jgi:pyrroloquinoline quinone biosynthesis protein E
MNAMPQPDAMVAPVPRPPPPLALLAELTHRCPLQCPYCSNPVELERAGMELDTATWKRVIGEAAAMGLLQVHFSGGEPTVRRDLAELVAHASRAGLYTNLITSGVMLGHARLEALVAAGLDHVQISFQDSETESAERIGNYAGAQAKKLDLAREVHALGLALTMNAVVHRQNLHNLPALIDLALQIGAERLEVAHVQYYGWALRNRAALLPTRAQLDAATGIVDAARLRLKGRLVIDYVVPDYYAKRPKSCMGGWGRQFLNISPAGRVLPCHAAESITGLVFDSVKDRALSDIWANSAAFQAYRGTDWMPPLCRSCDRREIDWGGCRCQAFALLGDAGETDPACAKSPRHAAIFESAIREAGAAPPDFVYRRIGG